MACHPAFPPSQGPNVQGSPPGGRGAPGRRSAARPAPPSAAPALRVGAAGTPRGQVGGRGAGWAAADPRGGRDVPAHPPETPRPPPLGLPRPSWAAKGNETVAQRRLAGGLRGPGESQTWRIESPLSQARATSKGLSGSGGGAGVGMGGPVTSAGSEPPPTSGRQAQPPWDPRVRLPSPRALRPPLLSQGQLPGPTCSHPFNSCLDPQECPQECAPPRVRSQDMTLPQTKSQHHSFPSWAPTENRG